MKRKWLLCAMLIMIATMQRVYAKEVTWCVYDIAGNRGDIMQLMKDYVIAAKSWNMSINTKVYQNEEQAVQDYNNKKCDGLVASTFITKSLNNFTGSIGAVGLIPDNQVAKSVFMALASPSIAGSMIENGHEVVGWMPLGNAYFMVRDNRLNSITQLAGRRLSVLKYDLSQQRMAKRVGAQPVVITFDNAGQKFINDEIDILAAPIYAYQPLQLNQALGYRGGVINFPVSFISLNFLIRQHAFPTGYGQKSRDWFKARTPRMMQNVVQWERTLPNKYWYDIPAADRSAYQRLLAQLRKEFIKTRVYDPALISMVLRINCRVNPQYFECKLK